MARRSGSRKWLRLSSRIAWTTIATLALISLSVRARAQDETKPILPPVVNPEIGPKAGTADEPGFPDESSPASRDGSRSQPEDAELNRNRPDRTDSKPKKVEGNENESEKRDASLEQKPVAEPVSYRDRFESKGTTWRREEADTEVRIIAHERTETKAREGKSSERIAFEAGVGAAVYYSHEIPKIPVGPNAEIGLYVRSNREGVRLMARVVLPADIDPDTHQPSFILVSGAAVDTANIWRKLLLSEVQVQVRRRVRVLRAATKRPVPLDGAYIDQVVVNLYAGPGETEVFLDDLEAYPVPAEALAEFAKERRGPVAEKGESPEGKAAAPRIALREGLLTLDEKPWFFSLISAPGAKVLPLRQAGFDVIAIEPDADDSKIADAVRDGFLLMPEIHATGPIDKETVMQRVQAFAAADRVAFWNIGRGLGLEPDLVDRNRNRDLIRGVITDFHDWNTNVSRMTTAWVDGAIEDYARPPKNIDLIGVEARNWGRMRDPLESLAFLKQRVDLGFENPNALFWLLIDAKPSPRFQEAIWGTGTPPEWGRPTIQPEQLRIWTYLAIAAGFRGVGFRADENFTGPAGIPLRTEAAFLNLEIGLFRSILARAKKSGELLNTYMPDPLMITSRPAGGGIKVQNQKPAETPANPTIKAVPFTTMDKKTTLLFIADFAAGAQWQPPQMSMSGMRVIVPAPEGAQGYEVTPASVQKLARNRVPGGIELTLPEFGVSSIIVVTTDRPLVERLEEQVVRNQSLAVQMAIEQAKLMIDWVTECDDRLRGVWENSPPHPMNQKQIDSKPSAVAYITQARELLALGRTDVARRNSDLAKNLGAPFEPYEDSPERILIDADAIEFLAEARDDLVEAQEALEDLDYDNAWRAARRVGRPLRMLMREHFERAFKGMRDVVLPYQPKPKKGQEDKVKDPEQIVAPISSPPLVSFNTLPQHWIWIDKMRDWRFGKNLLESGTFEERESLEELGWRNESYQYNGIEGIVETIKATRPKAVGKTILRLKVSPIYPENIDEVPRSIKDRPKAVKDFLSVEKKLQRRLDIQDAYPPFLDFPPAAIRTPDLNVRSGQLVRIRLWVKKPLPNVGGGGGLIIRDTLGGEPLQYRSAEGLFDWREIILFRRVPSDGVMSVLIGLAGYGVLDVDDVRVELGVGEPPERARPTRRPPITRIPKPADRPAESTHIRTPRSPNRSVDTTRLPARTPPTIR